MDGSSPVGVVLFAGSTLRALASAFWAVSPALSMSCCAVCTCFFAASALRRQRTYCVTEDSSRIECNFLALLLAGNLCMINVLHQLSDITRRS